MKPSDFVQNIIENGYTLTFLLSPTPFHARNNEFDMRNQHFESEAITELLNSNCIEKLDQTPYCCNNLTVVERKKTHVLDIHHFSKFIRQNKFCYKNLNTISETIRTNDFFTTFDLSSVYHHIKLHLQRPKFLRFQWTFEGGRTRFSHFNIIPFGLSFTCYSSISLC